MIPAAELHRDLVRWTAEHSGHESDRAYLGMSQIHRDEDELVQMLQGHQWTPSDRDHLRLRLGRVFEDEIMERLWGLGVITGDVYRFEFEDEVVADFDSRFRGHIDGYLTSGQLLEVKSVYDGKLDRIASSRRLPQAVFEQTQMYMAHGGFEAGLLVYIARDTGRLHVRDLTPNEGAIRALNAKARRVLARFDQMRSARARQALPSAIQPSSNAV